MSKIHMLVDASAGSQDADRHADDYTVCGYTDVENLNLTTWAEVVDCKKCLKRMTTQQPQANRDGGAE